MDKNRKKEIIIRSLQILLGCLLLPLAVNAVLFDVFRGNGDSNLWTYITFFFIGALLGRAEKVVKEWRNNGDEKQH